jgi:hypothetical protein
MAGDVFLITAYRHRVHPAGYRHQLSLSIATFQSLADFLPWPRQLFSNLEEQLHFLRHRTTPPAFPTCKSWINSGVATGFGQWLCKFCAVGRVVIPWDFRPHHELRI